jgi:predicted kinase
MLIALAGLPGTGKSTLAGLLATRLPAVVLDKDRVRACLFPPGDIAYSADQDDFVMDVVYRLADQLLRRDRGRHVFIDGRTFSKQEQVTELLRWASRIGVPLKMIECVCADEVAESRLGQDAACSAHPAANRTVALYRSLKAQADPLTVPRLVIDTGRAGPAACAEQALAYLRGAG